MAGGTLASTKTPPRSCTKKTLGLWENPFHCSYSSSILVTVPEPENGGVGKVVVESSASNAICCLHMFLGDFLYLVVVVTVVLRLTGSQSGGLCYSLCFEKDLEVGANYRRFPVH